VVESGRFQGEDMSLNGTYNHTIDGKGRVIVPSRFREELGENFVITKGLDGCLFVFPQTEWKELKKNLEIYL
jgi:MraZ protein